MANKLYVGNLPFSFTAQYLQKLFGTYGAVRSAEVIMDRVTGRSRGFGFVEMETPQATQDAIAGLNEKDMKSDLTVNEARERTPRQADGAGDRGGSTAAEVAAAVVAAGTAAEADAAGRGVAAATATAVDAGAIATAATIASTRPRVRRSPEPRATATVRHPRPPCCASSCACGRARVGA
jgi:RNA recognition motif-containing protein